MQARLIEAAFRTHTALAQLTIRKPSRAHHTARSVRGIGAMDSLLVWAFWAIAIAVVFSLGLALSSADPIGRFLRRQLWPDAEGGAPVKK